MYIDLIGTFHKYETNLDGNVIRTIFPHVKADVELASIITRIHDEPVRSIVIQTFSAASKFPCTSAAQSTARRTTTAGRAGTQVNKVTRHPVEIVIEFATTLFAVVKCRKSTVIIKHSSPKITDETLVSVIKCHRVNKNWQTM